MGQGPTIGRRRLGIELRTLRRAASLTGEQAGEVIEVSGSKISRLETGKTTLKKRELSALLEAYGVTDNADLDRLHNMAQVAAEQSWLDDYEDVLPSGLDTYVGLEEAATQLRSYTNHLVHGLLQTADYARAVITAQRPRERAAIVDRLVELRMRRQHVLHRDDPLNLWTIIEESALRRPVGGTATMAAQLDHILQTAEAGHVRLQLLPLAKGAHAGCGGPFTIIGFADPTDRDVVYIDSSVGNLYIQNPRDVDDITERFHLLIASALDPDESVTLTQEIRKEMK